MTPAHPHSARARPRDDVARTPPPGPRGLPVLGSTLETRRAPHRFFERCWREYGDIFQFRAGHQRVVVVADPESIARVLIRERARYVKGSTYDGLRLIAGDGLATSDGDRWRARRRQLQPLFSRELAAARWPWFWRLAGDELERWRARHGDEARVDVHALATALTHRVLMELLFGLAAAREAQVSARALEAALEIVLLRSNQLVALPLWMPTPANLRLRRALATLRRVIDELSSRARAASPAGPPTMLRELTRLRDAGELDARALQDELLTMFLAGYETVALTLTWGLSLLADAPEVTRALRVELAGAPRGDRGAPAPDQLPYARAVVDEVLRLRSPAWIIARDCVEDGELGGHQIARGSVVLCSQWLAHRHPDHWRDPERFDPARFLEPRPRHECAYFPFSRGPRTCVGKSMGLLESRALLLRLLESFDVERRGEPQPEFRPLNNLRPDGPVWLWLRARRA